MGENIGAVKEVDMRRVSSSQDPFAEFKYDEIRIYNLGQGDSIRIVELNGNKYLSVNNKPVLLLPKGMQYNRFVLQGDKISRETLDVVPEVGHSHEIQLVDQKGTIQDVYSVAGRKEQEKNVIEKFVESPVKPSVKFKKGGIMGGISIKI